MILNRQTRVRVALTPLEKFARQLRHELRLDGSEVSICLVSDSEMARLNKKYRRKNKATDVLSFSLGNPVRQRARGAFLGDIAIAPNVARGNAKRFARTLDEELRILILHGVLHLMGYDHESDRGQMDRRERVLRRRLRLE